MSDTLYKIVIREANNETGVETLTFLIANVLPKENKDNFDDFLTHMGRLQDLTGLRFLTSLDSAGVKLN